MQFGQREKQIVDKETETLLSKGNITTHVRRYNNASPIGFGNFPHEDKCYITSDQLIKDKMQRLTTFKQGCTT